MACQNGSGLPTCLTDLFVRSQTGPRLMSKNPHHLRYVVAVAFGLKN